MRANKRIRRRFKSLATLTLAILSPHLGAQVLPPPAKPAPTPQIFVKEFKFEGATAFSSAELAKITAPYTNRSITATELEEARRAISLHYANKGYINSGAIFPDQDPNNGVVTVKIVEGKLTKIDVRDNQWLTDGYIKGQLRRWTHEPLNLNEVKEGLQLLRQNPNIKRINAELAPGAAPGEGVLDVRVEDQQPFRVALEIDNNRPPSVGGEQVSLYVADMNLSGHSDVLELSYGIANSGADNGWGFSKRDDIGASYMLPLNRYNTTIGAHASRLSTSITEEPFTPLDIESETISYGLVLRQPIYQTANRELALSAAFDRRQNESMLLGAPFDFSGSGSVGGMTRVSVFRFSQEWVDRGQNHVLAFRSTFNFGLDAFDATDNGIPGNPDAQFFAWLGQAQYVRRLFETQNQVILRLTGQWSAERLLALEQVSVGGSATVRGYRENQLVRDRGLVASVEFRIPVLFNKAGAGIIQLAPFADFGGAWNVGETRRPDTIGSVGMGLLINPSKHIEAQLYWGYQLRDIDTLANDDAQDLGLHFRVKLAAF